MRILIAEDELVAKKKLHNTLLRMGHEVFVTENGVKALKTYNIEHPDVIITDWIMPEMDGIELCKRIRGSRRERYPFVIIVTANDAVSNRGVGYEAGADDFIGKPVDELELQLRLRACERIITLQIKEKKLRHKLFQALSESKEKNYRLELTMNELQTTQVKLTGALEEAKEATRAKSSFLANMSHELRTPLNAIIGYSEILCEEIEDGDFNARSNDFADDIAKINSSGTHLLTLINDILDISSIEAGKFELSVESFSLLSLIQELVTCTQKLIAKNHNTLKVECDETIGEMIADSTRVYQILYNLLINAAKFTENGDIVLFVERKITESDEWIYVRITDTGIGMTSEQINLVFNAFSQADDSATRKYGGTGLGLTITKRLCQLMGGDICVTSMPDKGAVFTVALPSTTKEYVHS